MQVKRKLFNRIRYNGKTYKRTDSPMVGGIAQSLKTNRYLTKDKYYVIDDYIWKDGESPSIIGDDGEPCGLHKCFTPTDFLYFL
jgi:hypothetical protein